ncbi:DNA topoisomerase 3-beta isoform X3 [Manihot esculenta]|uniref:DNA topoisomerase 3-beta isoform X3 n=1 Tax=Manihot esculenta TaxID=3983 RepID=UPI001CC541A1|nr:DNA topoisomerase 3-beta isoform X3 [Manihot esculenta]
MAPSSVLMVAEKPSIALSIASVLSGGRMFTKRGSTEVHEFDGTFLGFPAHYKVTSVIGHIFSVDFPSKYQDWTVTDPTDLFQAQIVKTETNPKAHICRHLSQEARGCGHLVLWLDCDREGENICFEVIECTGFRVNDARRRVYRARFSSVTEKDIFKALDNLAQPNRDEALAVDARQEIDLKVGVAFTRFQTSFFQGKYGNLDSRVISYGPCQTPTLGYCVQRYLQIATFKPEKFWAVQPHIIVDGYELQLEWERHKLFDLDVAMMFQKQVIQDGILEVIDISEKQENYSRPPGLNTVNLLKVASSALGIGPQTAMQLAERLYTQGFISYPRTESTAYPSSFDFKSTLGAMSNNSTWGNYVRRLLADGYHKPRLGTDVGDHPPITPIQLASENMLGKDAWRLYQYVCQHFIASVSPDCKYVRTKVEFSVGGEFFHCIGKRVTVEGFTCIMPWLAVSEKNLPQFTIGEKIEVSKVDLYEVQAGRRLVPTTLGITLIRGYQCIDPDLCLPDIRSFIEQQITLIAKGQVDHSRLVQHVLQQFKQKYCYFVKQIDKMDSLFEAQFSQLFDSGRVLSKCGKCLRYMKYISALPSRLYCGTCEDVYFLPQKGTIKLYKELTCPLDNFELLLFSMGGPEGKTFPLCPYCYNSPPFEGIDKLFGASESGNFGKLGKGAGMPCFLCPHPTCRHSLIAQAVCACPECSGTLVLDPVSAPKWRLYCNMCNCLVLLPQGAHRIATTRERCPECDSTIIEVDFNKNTTPLEDGATLHIGCILCDDLLHSLVEVKHGKSFFKRMGRGGRGRGRGGRGRASARRGDPRMSFRDF